VRHRHRLVRRGSAFALLAVVDPACPRVPILFLSQALNAVLLLVVLSVGVLAVLSVV